MKPAKFDYFAPTTLDEALELLAQHGPDAKVLAGGQSLMPMMNLRLVRPAVVVDINRIEGLSGISASDGAMSVGALTRQRDLQRSDAISSAFPVMAAPSRTSGISRYATGAPSAGAWPTPIPPPSSRRSAPRWTPSSCWPPAAARRPWRLRSSPSAPLITSLEPEQLLTEIRLPMLQGDGWRWGFREVSRREGDFALVGSVAMLRTDGDGVCREARITMFAVGDGPMRVPAAEAALVGRVVDDAARREAAALVSEAVTSRIGHSRLGRVPDGSQRCDGATGAGRRLHRLNQDFQDWRIGRIAGCDECLENPGGVSLQPSREFPDHDRGQSQFR